MRRYQKCYAVWNLLKIYVKTESYYKHLSTAVLKGQQATDCLLQYDHGEPIIGMLEKSTGLDKPVD